MPTENVIIHFRADGTREVQRGIKEIGGHAKESASTVELLKKALEFAGIALGIGEVLKTLTQFSRVMAQVQNATGATSGQMKKLSDDIQAVAIEAGKSPIEAARAFQALAKAGLATNDSLRATLDLMTLTGGEASATATDLGRVMNAFSMGAEHAEKAADLLAVTSQKSGVNFEELTTGISHAASAAQRAGLSLGETSAIVTILSKTGANSRQVITELKGALETLEQPTIRDAIAFQQAGVAVERAKPSVVGLAGTLRELSKGTLSFESLGIKGGAALDSLTQRNPQLKELLTLLEGSSGAAKKMAGVVDDSVAGAFERLKGSVDSLIVAFGVEGGLAGAIKNIATSISFIASQIKGVASELHGMADDLVYVYKGVVAMGGPIQQTPASNPPGLKAENDRRIASLKTLLDLEDPEGRFIPPAGPASLITRKPVLSASPEIDAVKKTEPVSKKTELRIAIETQLTEQLGQAKMRLGVTEEALKNLLEAQIIDQEQYNAAWSQTILDAQTLAPALDVLKAKFLSIDTSVQGLASGFGDVLTAAIDKTASALSAFAVSGFRDVESLKAALSSLLEDISKEILQLIIKMLIIKTIKYAIGGGSGGADLDIGDAVAGSKALGGPVERGRPIIVGEHGRELFVPPSQGNIVPNGQAAGAPQVHVQVVNVEDPSQVTRAINSPDGEKSIINVLGKHKESIRAILGAA